MSLAVRTLRESSLAFGPIPDVSSREVRAFVDELRAAYSEAELDWNQGLIFEFSPIEAMLAGRPEDVRQRVAVALLGPPRALPGVEYEESPPSLALRMTGSAGDAGFFAAEILKGHPSWVSPLRGLEMGRFLRVHFRRKGASELESTLYIEVGVWRSFAVHQA